MYNYSLKAIFYLETKKGPSSHISISVWYDPYALAASYRTSRPRVMKLWSNPLRPTTLDFNKM